MIPPTHGRVVLFTPGESQPITQHDKTKPLAAIVTHVWHDRMVNVAVFDSNGVLHPCTSVTLLQDDDVGNPSGYFAEWMPYQKGQAAKTEQLEKQVGGPPRPSAPSSHVPIG